MKYIALAVFVLIAIWGVGSLSNDTEAPEVASNSESTQEPQEAQEPEQAPEELNENLLAFYADAQDTEEFITTASGLSYAVLKPGEPETNPTVNDTVRVHYHGTLRTGEIFDSSVISDNPIEFELLRLIPGWQEGIPLMTIGSKYRFIVPAVLAYGEDGAHPLAGQDLIFDIELLGVPSAQ